MSRFIPTLALLALAPVATSGAQASRPRIQTLTDKTLVAWVCLANTTQRGGSALTLIDSGERFDAIVFGEVAPGRWMAGSDFFHRTVRDQAACPPETADSKTAIQIAIVYKGKQVTVYRDGKLHSQHAITQSQSFGRDTSVLFGLRYVGHMGTIGFLAGAIEEARIYDVALDAKAIAALAPNRPSDPRPIGLWIFEDGTANDQMGNFPPGQLRGGARIAGGKLHLNGSDAYMISESVTAESQLMFYRPLSKETGIMWDTWLYLHDGTYYLYYLARVGGQWNNISMATSPDGVHWKELGPILHKADGVTWMGTGSTWSSPSLNVVDAERPNIRPHAERRDEKKAKDGKFQMNFSEWRGPRQTIFFAESTDLVHWKRLGNEFEFKQDTRWYEENGRWDCIWTLARPNGGFCGYWTATPKPETGGRFGFGETLDGVTWKALKPPETPGVGEGEVGAIEKIGDRYYMLYGTGGFMVTLVAERPEGPFHPAKKNLRVLAGHTYFARFFPTPSGLLVNHHSIARNGMVFMGTLKRAVVDQEGTLRLAWWDGNEKLKGDAIDVKLPQPGPAPVAMLANDLDIENGIVLEGTLALPQAAAAQRPGIYIECGKDSGAAILVGPGGVCELGPMATDGSGFQAEKRVDREMAFGASARVRLLLKHSLLEFYLDDILIECYSLPAAASGRIGLVRGSRGDAFARLTAWLVGDGRGDKPGSAPR